MFAKLTGVIDDLAEDHLVLDCNGVGYLVQASAKTLATLIAGETASLRIETMVGDDHIRLYGFRSRDEQYWFKLLQSVQGVGARVALAILSILPPDRLTTVIATQDKASIAQANGVGPKLAQRIVSELKDKASLPLGAASDMPQAMPSAGLPTSVTADALSALANLGYAPSQAHMAVMAALAIVGTEADLSSLIRQALKEVAK